MAVESVLTDAATGRAIATVQPTGRLEDLKLTGKEVALVVVPVGGTFGTFKSASRTTAGTTTVTDPAPGGSIIITDLLISTDKTNATSVTVQFTDGTDTVVVFEADSSNAPVNVGTSFSGRWQGWEDARIDMVTVGAVTATVAVGYVKIPVGLPFAEWDGLR